jgi:hypothetical protein
VVAPPLGLIAPHDINYDQCKARCEGLGFHRTRDLARKSKVWPHISVTNQEQSVHYNQWVGEQITIYER